jgi:hypothetical protein
MSTATFGFPSKQREEQIASWRWEGSLIRELTGTPDQLYRALPTFTRHPFGDNLYKDEIRREPVGIADAQIPIAMVSKSYSLIQHREVLSSVYRALLEVGKDCSAIHSAILISEYGERMQWSCEVPGFGFDPGDGHPIVLRINCMNSVDKTTALEISLGWFRLVCTNGMMFGMADSNLRMRHIKSLNVAEIAAYLNEQFEAVEREQRLCSKWLTQTIRREVVVGWTDEVIAKKWGAHSAARVWHIISEGMDGEVQAANDKRPPHKLELKSPQQVPGAPIPADNLYHVSQALSWVAGSRKNIQERIEYLYAVPQLLESLTT